MHSTEQWTARDADLITLSIFLVGNAINKITWVPAATTLILALVASSSSYREHRDLDALHAEILMGKLQPIATLLKEDQALTRELNAEPFTEKDSGLWSPISPKFDAMAFLSTPI